MDVNEKIRSCWERTTHALAKRPEVGKVTRTVTARMTDGLTCEIEAEGVTFKADMPVVAGGNGAGLPASTYGEASLASCLAIGYRMWFAVRNVPVEQIEVEVTGIFDVGGMYGVGEAPIGFDGPLRYEVRVESSADEEVVADLIDQAEAHSPMMHVFKHGTALERKLKITTPALPNPA